MLSEKENIKSFLEILKNAMKVNTSLIKSNSQKLHLFFENQDIAGGNQQMLNDIIHLNAILLHRNMNYVKIYNNLQKIYGKSSFNTENFTDNFMFKMFDYKSVMGFQFSFVSEELFVNKTKKDNLLHRKLSTNIYEVMN